LVGFELILLAELFALGLPVEELAETALVGLHLNVFEFFGGGGGSVLGS
jgi:hypothetical protein